MMNVPDENMMDVINEEMMIIHSMHSILQDSIKFREFHEDKNVLGEYSIVMEIMDKHMKNIINLF